MSARQANRRADLGRIHILAKEIGLSRDQYEDLLWSLCRVRSAGDLDCAGRQQVIEHLSALARRYHVDRRSRAGGKRPAVAPDREAQLRKLEALLADAGRSWAYLESAKPGRLSMVQRLCKVDALRFCTAQQLGKLIAALSYDAQRRAAKASA